MAENTHGEEFRDLIATMETQRATRQDANDAWWQNQEAMEERSSLPPGFFSEAEAKLQDGKRAIRDIQERMQNQVQDIVNDVRETVDEQTPEYKAYMIHREAEDARFERAMAYMESEQYLADQGAIVERRWMEHEAWLASAGKEGEPHHQFLDGQTEAEALVGAAQERLMRQEQQRLEAAVQFQAFEGKTPEAQRQVYVQQVTQDAIRTGIEEGYPIRDRATVEHHVREQATPAHVESHIALLRKEAGLSAMGQRSLAPEPWGADHKPAWERGANTDVSR